MPVKNPCPSCGHPAGPGETFCPACGTRIARTTGSGSPAGKNPVTNILAAIPWTADQFARYDRDVPWQKRDASPPPLPADPAGDSPDEHAREPGACRTCGSPLEPDRKFCTRCGEPAGAAVATARQPAPGQPACPACGRPADPGDRFCEGCGMPVEQTGTRQLPGACPRCGAKNPAGRKFCEQCGALVPVSRR